MSPAPETKVVIAGGGLSVRYGNRRAFCHGGMSDERFAAASAECDALLREMVADLIKEEARLCLGRQQT